MTLLVLFQDNTLTPVVPQVETYAASDVEGTTATGNGEVVGSGGSPVTIRGFEYNTVAYPDKVVQEAGSIPTGTFDLELVGLTPGQMYFYRAFATNSVGTGYGAWKTFIATASTYSIMINGIDRTTDVLVPSLNITDELTDQTNTCQFSLIDRSGNGMPDPDEEIIITLSNGDKLFGGYLLEVGLTSRKNTGVVQADISCVDYTRLLDRNLVTKSYTNMTDAEIITDILDTYCPGFGITATNVVEGVTIDQINFNYIQPSQAIRRIADLTGRNWYIDYDKDIHYFPLVTAATPFNITDVAVTDYSGLSITKDASQLKNRVYVRGGTRLSDPTTFSTKGDGVMRKFVLPDKPHDVSITVNGVSKTLGIKNIDTSGYDWYMNFQEKYVEQDAGGVVLGTGDTLVVNYTYDIPILVAVEDTASIIEHGQKEFAIFDKEITTQQSARDRASAELTDYANNLIEGSFATFTDGFRTGQYLTINLASYGINDVYIVQRVTAISYGAGHYYYQVDIASAKTMGIIRFLIELLENNGRLVEVDDDEVVDNLLSISDSLLSDSLIDNLTIDSAGAYATWCTDSLQSTPATRAIWDLYQWG